MKKWELPSVFDNREWLSMLFCTLLGVSAAFWCFGCEWWPKVARTAVDIAPCAVEEYGLVKDAIQDPRKAETYLSIIGELLHCAPAVIRDLEASNPPAAIAHTSVLVASADGKSVYPDTLTLEGRRRIRVVKLLLRNLRTP